MYNIYIILAVLPDFAHENMNKQNIADCDSRYLFGKSASVYLAFVIAFDQDEQFIFDTALGIFSNVDQTIF